jgi:hypothetical protein
MSRLLICGGDCLVPLWFSHYSGLPGTPDYQANGRIGVSALIRRICLSDIAACIGHSSYSILKLQRALLLVPRSLCLSSHAIEVVEE